MTKRLGNRIVSFVLAALLLLTSVPMQAFAEGEAGTETAAVDWENVIDDCEIEMLEGNSERPIENLRDGDPNTLWNMNTSNGTAILKFVLPTERLIKKIAIQMENTEHTQTMSLLNGEQEEISGTRKENVVRKDGYEWIPSASTSMKEFCVKLEGGWPQIAEMQIFAERNAASALETNIIEECEIQVPMNESTKDNMKSDINTVWVEDWGSRQWPCEVTFTPPKGNADPVSRVAFQFEQAGDGDRTMDVGLRYTALDADGNETVETVEAKTCYLKVAANDTEHTPGFQYQLPEPKRIKNLTVILTNPITGGVEGVFSPGISLAEIYVQKETENIAKKCTLTATKPDAWGNVLTNIQDGNEGTIWTASANDFPVTVRFAIPENETISRAVLKFNNADDIKDRSMHIKMEYAKDDNEIKKLLSEKTDQVLKDNYEIGFSKPRTDMKYLYVTLVKTNESGDLCPSFREIELYAEKKSQRVESVAVTSPDGKSALEIGETLQLEATASPDMAENKGITWSSSDEAIATVDANGLVTAKAEGNVTITATAADGGGAKGSIELSVTPIKVKGITVTAAGGATSLNVPQTLQLTAGVSPEDAADKSVTWSSSDEAIATVDESGLVTAVKAGTVKITATANDGSEVTGGYDLTAVWVSMTGITLDTASLDLKIGDIQKLTATVAPEDASDPAVTWSSSDEDVASVSEDGTVTAVKPGTATITAAGKTETDVKQTVSVTVQEPNNKVTGITIGSEGSVHTLPVPQTLQLTATVAPADADVKNVKWGSSDPKIATVDENGLVTAVKAGPVKITATAMDGSGTVGEYALTVEWIPVTGITLAPSATEVTVGGSLKLTVTVAPENASNGKFTLSSSDPKIATVDQEGNVKALRAGKATVTATAKDTTNPVSKSVELTVSPMPEGELNLAADGCSVSAKNASGHEAAKALDGKKDTYWQSIPSGGEGDEKLYNRMYDHNKYIDIALDGTYQLSKIQIWNRTDGDYSGSYNNYYIYASKDGVNYDKIISKTSNGPATAEGDSYEINAEAAYLRLNMAYNSNSFATNLAEISVHGAKICEEAPEPEPISVTDWKDSEWKTEWDKFEANEGGYADQKVLAEMSNLVGRVVGEKWKGSFRFAFRDSLKEGSDIFEIKDGENNEIVIKGNSGVAMASGFNYYLKNYVNVDYNPLYGSNTNLKEIKPVGRRIVREAQFDLRYALNFCTYSYTMSFWNWDEYEEFLDWSAMNGINLILDIVGQEEVLRQTFAQFGFSDEEVKDYICGPAYFAWFYMQNLYSIGGPLPNAWFEQRAELGRKIHDRMQTFGIDPVMQGFAGQVPETFVKKNEGAVFTPVDEWPSFTRPSIIKTYLSAEEEAAGKKNYFSDVAKVFYEKQKNLFGDVSHYYATDPFHEGGKTGGLDVGNIYHEVQREMMESDPEAIWVMQQWQGNLDANKMSQLDASHTLPLDLHADMNPDHGLFESKGAPWIYCMLHNFGGRMGLDGEIPVIASDPIQTMNETQHMKGIGMTPEAMENGPVVYELLFDTTWSKDPIDYRAWLKTYGERRAGGESESLDEAWKILLQTAYADKGITYQGAAESVINARPGDHFSAASSWGHSNILYDKAELDSALLLLIENYEAFQDSPAYKYDLADVAEQVLCNAAIEYHKMMVQAKNEGDITKFEKLSTDFLGLMDLSDQILSTTDEFMLGTWIEAARKMIVGADDWTKDLFEFNARSLVTTWGGERSGSLKDYSNRKWSGLTSSFYKERWAIWIRNRMAELKSEKKDPADEKAESNWFLWEHQWAQRKSDDDEGAYSFTATPSDADLGALAQKAYDLYSYTNLEKNTGGTVQETTNVAKGKKVSLVTPSATKQGTLSNITDGEETTDSVWVAEGEGPHTFEIDLDAECQVKDVTLVLSMLAKKFPYTYKVEYVGPEAPEWTLLEENNSADLDSQMAIAANDVLMSQIRVTMTTGDTVDSPLTITEVRVNGVEVGKSEKFENLALGIAPTVTDKTGGAVDGDTGKMTDGDEGTLWAPQSWSNDRYPLDIEVDLQQSAYIDSVNVQFESEGRPFAFAVSVTDVNGIEKKVSSEYEAVTDALAKRSYQIPVGQDARYVTVSLITNTGAGDYPASWPAIAEIAVMGTSAEENAALVSGVSVSGGGANMNSADGNKDTFNKVELDQEIVFDLGKTYYVPYTDITFEKGELGLKYQVFAESESGERKQVSDQSESKDLLGDRTVRVPVRMDARKIIFIHKGNNGSGPASQAEARLYELEAYGIPKTPVSLDAAGLVNSNNYTASPTNPLVLTLSKEEKIANVAVTRASSEKKPIQFKAEYQDADGAWKAIADLTDNADAALNTAVAVAAEEVTASKLRLTFTEGIELSGLAVSGASGLISGVTPSGEMTDGDKGTWSAVGLNTETVFDLGEECELSNVDLTFEKGGLGIKYQVYAEDAAGKRELLSDQSEATGRLDGEVDESGNPLGTGDGVSPMTVSIPANGVMAKKIIFIHMGNNGSGPSYAAEARLYEAEIFGKAKVKGITVEPEEAMGLLGEKEPSYTAAAGAAYEVALEKAADVSRISVTSTADESKPLRYKVEYQDEEGDYQTFADLTENRNAGASGSYAIPAEPAFTNKLRLTFSEDVRIQEICLYPTDYSKVLAARIAAVRAEMKKLSFDGSNGSYSAAAKEKLDALLAEAEAASVVSAKTIDGWLERIDEAVHAVYTDGEIFISGREDLLTVMASIRELIEKYSPTADQAAELEKIYAAAREAYDAYRMPQSEIDSSLSDVSGQLLAAGSALEAAQNPSLAAARADLKELLDGLEERTPEDYTKESWKAYINAVLALKDVLIDWNATEDLLAAVKARLEEAIAGLKKAVKITGITLRAEKDKTTLEVDGTVQILATIEPDDADNQTLSWASEDKSVASVDRNGLVTAYKSGDTVITATATDGSGVFGTIALTVTKKTGGGDPEDPDPGVTDPDPILVEKIDLTAEKTRLAVRETVTVTATLTPENASNQELSWSSDDSAVASVSQDGKVTANAPGEAVITATATDGSEAAGKITITVTEASDPGKPDPDPILVEKIDLTAEKTRLAVGETVTVTATLTPENASNQKLSWSSDDSAVATVSQDGKVTANAPGEAVITATATDGSEATGKITITVTEASDPGKPDPDPILVEKIDLTAEKTRLAVGETVTVTATLMPENASNQKLSWSSDDSAVATVSQDGTVTANAPGEAVITATATDGSEATGKITFTVTEDSDPGKPIPVKSVTVTAKGDQTELAVGETVQLVATVAPDNASVKDVAWSSSDEKAATVDAKGMVTAKSAGKVKITAKATDKSEVSGEITLTVLEKSDTEEPDPEKPVLAEKVTVTAEDGKVSLKVGDTLRLAAAVAPENASVKDVAWSSSDEKAATVDEQGVVTAVAAGEATITATVKDEGKAAGRILLTVSEKDLAPPKKGETKPVGNVTYKVTSSTAKKRTVTLLKPKKKNIQKAVIKPTVKINGYTFKITEIGAKAFKGSSKLTQVTIGANIQKIGKSAFENCRKLKKIYINSKNITKIEKNAFKGIKKGATIYVPKKKYDKYKRFLKQAKLPKYVKIKKK